MNFFILFISCMLLQLILPHPGWCLIVKYNTFFQYLLKDESFIQKVCIHYRFKLFCIFALFYNRLSGTVPGNAYVWESMVGFAIRYSSICCLSSRFFYDDGFALIAVIALGMTTHGIRRESLPCSICPNEQNFIFICESFVRTDEPSSASIRRGSVL